MAAYGDPWCWQLHPYLWCHQGELSIGFVCRFSQILIFYQKYIFTLLFILVWYGENDSTCFSEWISSIASLPSQKTEKYWQLVYKTNGEFSSVTSQILVELPISRIPIKRHYTDLVKLWKFITLEPIIRFCSGFHYFLFLIFLHLLNAQVYLYFIPL